MVFGHLTALKTASTVTGPSTLSAPRYNKSRRTAIEAHGACVTDWTGKHLPAFCINSLKMLVFGFILNVYVGVPCY